LAVPAAHPNVDQGGAVRCCDLHNVHCEPPSELCCGDCPEAAHPNHPPGTRCVLDLGTTGEDPR
jgi:hypothetical protein